MGGSDSYYLNMYRDACCKQMIEIAQLKEETVQLKVEVAKLEHLVEVYKKGWHAMVKDRSQNTRNVAQLLFHINELDIKNYTLREALERLQYKGVTGTQWNGTDVDISLCRGCGQTDEFPCEPDCYISLALKED